MVKYQCVSNGKIYSEEQMRDLFRFKEYRGYTGTFEEWMKSELDNGYIINYTEKKTEMCLEDILEYARQHDLKFSDVHFVHDNGKKFTVLDADKELFGIEGQSGFFTLEDLEIDYENEQVFSICQ